MRCNVLQCVAVRCILNMCFSDTCNGEGMEARKKKERPKEDVWGAIAILRVEFAVIDVELCSSMTATFLQGHFLIKFNVRSFFLFLC